LERALQETHSPLADTDKWQGGWVGAFSYDGKFEFHYHTEASLIKSSELEIPLSNEPLSFDPWQSHMDSSHFCKIVDQAKEYIRAGDIYQVNLARRLECVTDESFDSWTFFQVLWTHTHAAQSAFLQLNDRSILSASPELFLNIKDRNIRTQPIKGTRPRGKNPTDDARLIDELIHHPKERAELIMITDLERNDLGQVCEYGSVQVTELVKHVQHSHVHHLVSTIEGRLRPAVTPLQALKACFPGGSITGAPKKRAMKIIAELEINPREFYTGSMGYFGNDGSAHFNIAIRTAEWKRNHLTFHVGSGITADSDPQAEFEETEHKAKALKEAYVLHAVLAASAL
jgi:anthranilate/para-aminobenzoate synthase component I